MPGDPASTGDDRARDEEEAEDKVEAARRLLREAISRPAPVPVTIRSTGSRPGPAGTGT